MTTALPRSLGRFVRLAPMPEDDARVVAADGVVDREVEIVRLPFERARRAERDALVASLRARTTVVSPAVRSVLDAGEWDDDVYVALELLRGSTPLASWALGADEPARARAAAEILGGAAVLSARGLSLAGAPEIVVDDYGQPKILGLERAAEGAPAEVAATEAALTEQAASAAPAPLAERVRQATEKSARTSLVAELERIARGGAAASFAADAAHGEAMLSAAGRTRPMLVALAVICFFAVVVTAALVILR